jgi:nucleoside phosphorylase
MIDPPRNEAKKAVSACAGIILMITGTTNSQQKPLQKQGIITSGKDVILSGTKWLRYQKKFSDIVEHVRVYACQP